jgi:asparagine N-glycosylation enzyme membrane subunit Stt3
MAQTNTFKAFIPWLLIAAMWAAVHGAIAMTVASPVFEGSLMGPDEYMRVVRVAELRDGGGWYDSVIERGNAPYGDTLHWTRPMDLVLLSGATLLSPFMPADDALFVTGVVISPLLALLTCLAVAWAAAPLIGRDRSILAVFLFLVQPGIVAYSMAGRSDHHALLFLLTALVIGGTLRTIGANPSARTALATGVAYGMAIWASVEMTLLVALCQATAAYAWIRFKHAKARTQLLAAGAFVATTVVALLAERPHTKFFTIEYDRVSIPYLAVAVLVAAVWAAAAKLEGRKPLVGQIRYRIPVIGGAACAGLIVLVALFPDIASGPFGAVDPRILPIWHANVSELKPLLPDSIAHTGEFLFSLGGVVLCLPYVIAMGWRHRKDASSFRWILLAVIITTYFLLSLKHFRFAPFAELASAAVLADMIARLVDWSERRLDMIRRVLVTGAACLALMFGGLLGGSYLLTLAAEASDSVPEPECEISAIAPALNDPAKLGTGPLVVAALLDHGPEILYRSPHAVVSAPYHRNGAGIWDSHRLFASPDETETRAIVTRRGVDLLLVCPSGKEKRFFQYEAGSNNLYSRIVDGKTPPWLAPVDTGPEDTTGFRLFRVIP